MNLSNVIDCAHAAWEYNSCSGFKEVISKINKEVFGIEPDKCDFLCLH